MKGDFTDYERQRGAANALIANGYEFHAIGRDQFGTATVILSHEDTLREVYRDGRVATLDREGPNA